MCYQSMRIKSVSPSGQKYSFIPCGKCEECRKSYRSQWFFRLSVEMQKASERGWHIGFFTLTYNDSHLPYYRCLDSNGVDHEFPCFRRSDVRRLVLRLRKKFHHECGVTGLRYLIASEYGDHTRRPHYHGVIAFPPSIEPSYMLEQIEHFWSDDNLDSLGFVFPSEKVYAQQKFLCKSPYAAALYASKYCCKDVAHERLFDGFDIPAGDVREFRSFHIQSRSLGLELLKDLTDEQKYELYKNGLSIVGSDKPLSIPLYIRNKIFFDPLYITDEKGNRLVRRLATPFLKKYGCEIFEKKVSFYQGFFQKLQLSDYWSSIGYSFDMSCKCADLASAASIYFGGLKYMSEYYVAYYGVPPYAREGSLVDSWLSRYSSCWFDDKESYDMTQVPSDLVLHNLLCHLESYGNPDVSSKKSEVFDVERQIDAIKDFHVNSPFNQVG